MDYPFLTVLGLLPLVVAILVALSGAKAGRVVGLVGALATLVYAAGIIVYVKVTGHSVAESLDWLPIIGSSYSLDLDGMGLVMVAMTVLLVPAVLVAEWKTGFGGEGRFSSKTFVALVLLVESFSLMSFLSFDLLVFYIFFEVTLIPMYFLIGGWGGAARGKAAAKFLIFGLAGGLIMLFGVVGTTVLSAETGAVSLNFRVLATQALGTGWTPKIIFIAFFIAFALKAPMVPGHIWLPDAAEESTPGGAALMVGILDKLGTFGMIRVCLGVFPGESQWATPVILILALISIFWGALAAIGSKNLMRLIAYTSISHFGFMVMGIFALTSQSLTGAIFYMVNHALATGALYLVIGYLIKRRGSANVDDFGGVVNVAPLAAGFTLVAGLASVALPGTSPFVSEFLAIAGTWTRYPVIAGIAVVGVVFAAVYVLWMYQRLMTGPVTPQTEKHITSDLTWRERWAVIPLVAAFLVLGFWPRPALGEIGPTSEYYMQTASVIDPVAQIEGGR
ncbi:MAG: NADH-quinone oxidoreductase subunit M [Propionibacteriaceae bacterium]|jgi:NADH-quinone oxidoreductase subunit M|nr:NADH-quinone oxidoreductase subunit M [Propionibacteriaceae bacterium]